MKIFVVPATYNEIDNIEKFIILLEDKIFPQITNHEMYILVADDNSPDGTGEVVKKLMKKYKNLDINQGPKKGLGAAYIRAMSYAIEKKGADVVISIDADFQFDPHDLPKFIKKIEDGYEVVIQSRYSKGGSIPKNWPPQRKAFSIIANLFVRTVFMKFTIHDWTGGFRAIKKEVFLKVRSEMKAYNGYIFQIAFLHSVVRKGFRIGEVPLHFSDRTLGNSKIAPAEYIFDVIRFVVGTRIKELHRVIKFLCVGGTGFIVQLVTQEAIYRLGVSHAIAQALISLGLIQDLVSSSNFFATAFGAEASIISNFLFNNFWTFKDTKHIKEQSGFFGRAIKFNIASFGSILIQAIAVFAGVKLFGTNMSIFNHVIPTRIAILFPTIIILVIPLNYFIYNVLIWKTQYLKHAQHKTS